VYKWPRLAELGIIGMPGASKLPSFVAVEITKDVRSLPGDPGRNAELIIKDEENPGEN
jgi:hypothetical protein